MEFVSLYLQIEPGYNRWIYTADEAVKAKYLAAKKGDAVVAQGIAKKSGGVRTTSIEITPTPVPGPVLVT